MKVRLLRRGVRARSHCGPERAHRQARNLHVLVRERNPDNGDEVHEGHHAMPDREPESREEEPEDVPKKDLTNI